MPRVNNPSELEQLLSLVKKLASDASQTHADVKTLKTAMIAMQENNHQLNVPDLVEKIATLVTENPSSGSQAGPSTTRKTKVNPIRSSCRQSPKT